MDDLVTGTRFQPVLDDPSISNKSQVERVVMLSGKAYYELVKERETRKLDDKVALVRIEELSPFPFLELKEVLSQYTRASDFVWWQEEPRNQGGYTHVISRIGEVLKDIGEDPKDLKYVGRKESAIPAPGIANMYRAQQAKVLSAAFENLP
jgi:probable 2-oxoglutarate dehydrogenase E1 component DHKTD1